ncbi:hypothetical protein Tco_1320231 [Tanacetum coccineum]
MLRSCPHHGFSELTQVDTFYNGLNENEQDSLNAAAGGNLLSKTTREALNIIENKSKVRYSRNKTNASRVNSKGQVSNRNERFDKLADQLPTLVEIVFLKRLLSLPHRLRRLRKIVLLVVELMHGAKWVSKEVHAQIPPPVIPKPIPEPVILKNFTNRYSRSGTLRFLEELYLRQIFSYPSRSRQSKDRGNASYQRKDFSNVCGRMYAPEVLGFPSDDFSSGNPTSTSEPFTSEFTLEEIDAYLYEKSISLESDHDDCDPEEDIYSEVTEAKSSIEEPPELELKDLPSHLEYAYLEENDKLPVIIAKCLKNDQKEALANVLKSHKRAIAWKITISKGYRPSFLYHKILMEDDCKPSVQSQRRCEPDIHEGIKKEVIKLLDCRMIYRSRQPVGLSNPLVSLKIGMSVVAMKRMINSDTLVYGMERMYRF